MLGGGGGSGTDTNTDTETDTPTPTPTNPIGGGWLNGLIGHANMDWTNMTGKK